MVASDDDIKSLDKEYDNNNEKKSGKESSLDKDDAVNEETNIKSDLEDKSVQQLDKNKETMLNQNTTDKKIVNNKT